MKALAIILTFALMVSCGKDEGGGGAPKPGEPDKRFSAEYLNASFVGVASGDGQPAREREFHLAIMRGAEE